MNKNALSDKAIDGKNILDLLKNEQKAKQRTLFWHYPHYSNQGGKPSSAMIRGNYKLIVNYEDNSMELYNIKADISEKYNLATIKASIVKRYKKTLDKWLADNRAKFPISNPAFSPLTKKNGK